MYVSVCGYVHIHVQVTLEPEEGFRSSVPGVIGICELLGMDAGNQICVLSKLSEHFLTWVHLFITR